MALIIFCIQLSPVMRTPGFTIANSPQNVKNTLDSMPLAAAVVARMVVGQMRSRSPPHAMIVSLFFFFTSPFEGLDSLQQVRDGLGRDALDGPEPLDGHVRPSSRGS